MFFEGAGGRGGGGANFFKGSGGEAGLKNSVCGSFRATFGLVPTGKFKNPCFGMFPLTLTVLKHRGYRGTIIPNKDS